MRIVGFICLGAILGPGMLRPSGCGSSHDETAVSTTKPPVSGSDPLGTGNDTFPTGEDSLYGDEPLVPAIRLDDEPQRAAVLSGPIVGGTDRPTPSVLAGFNSEILAADFTAGARASFHAHGEEVCASGCAASNHPTPELTQGRFQPLMANYQRGPLDETNEALEALLYYGRQSQSLLGSAPSTVLDAKHEQFLRRELRRTHALVSLRIVDEQGVVRVEMQRTRIPLDRRHVFDMDSHNLPPLVTSGTVKRVGLYHLWTRI